MNKGVFYRANAITPKGDDMSNLEKLGLTKVYDLRTEPEIASKPDVLPDGVAYENIPILSGNIAEMIAKIKSPEDSRSMMQDMNRAFVTGATERAGFAQLLTGLAETEGAQVFHCTAGKDRTGWTSFLLLSIAGVDRSVIMNDYLLTNEYTAEGMKPRARASRRAWANRWPSTWSLCWVSRQAISMPVSPSWTRPTGRSIGT